MLKNLLTTPCFLALLFSCGKNIESSGDKKKVIDKPALESSSILMEVDYIAEESNHQTKEYEIEGSGWAMIPEAPFVLQGSPLSFKTIVSFNVATLSTLGTSQEISCEYQSFRQLTPTDEPPEDGFNHSFLGCFTYIEGIKEKVNYEPGQEFPIDEGNSLMFEVSNSETTGNIQIQSDIVIDWH